MKKLLSRIDEVLGIRKGCSAALAEEGGVTLSRRKSLFGTTVSEPPTDWLQSYFSKAPLVVIWSSDFCAVASLPLLSLNCDLIELVPFCCWMLKVSVATRWPRTKIPKEPESTVCAAAGFSFLSPAWAGIMATSKETESRAAARIPDRNFTPSLLVRCGFRSS